MTSAVAVGGDGWWCWVVVLVVIELRFAVLAQCLAQRLLALLPFAVCVVFAYYTNDDALCLLRIGLPQTEMNV